MSLTLFFSNAYIHSTGNYAGYLEAKGPLGKYLDGYSLDLYDGMKNYELAERNMAKKAINHCLKKKNVNSNAINLLIGGDLLNQNMTSNFVAREFESSYIGIYSACANIGLGLIQSAIYADRGISPVLCFTSSHNATAERQFRYPLEYGVKKKRTSTFTATGSAAFLIKNSKSLIKISKATIGKVVDYGFKDANDMGSAMAPAAYQTITDHLKNTNQKFSDFDLIITGDLSKFGNMCLKKLLKEPNVDDCGLHLYDLKEQEVFQGGSGCACSALVLSLWILKEMENKHLKHVLFCPTGALLSLTSTSQKESIPCICHAVELEVVE